MVMNAAIIVALRSALTQEPARVTIGAFRRKLPAHLSRRKVAKGMNFERVNRPVNSGGQCLQETQADSQRQDSYFYATLFGWAR